MMALQKELLNPIGTGECGLLTFMQPNRMIGSAAVGEHDPE